MKLIMFLFTLVVDTLAKLGGIVLLLLVGASILGQQDYEGQYCNQQKQCIVEFGPTYYSKCPDRMQSAGKQDYAIQPGSCKITAHQENAKDLPIDY